MEISAVIPVFNEEQGLREFYNRFTRVMQSLKKSYEVIFVDDGSRDGSVLLLEKLAASDDRLVVVKFSRNFGHHIAVTAGLDYSKGDLVVVMDADLQDQPEELPKLLQKINEGYDVVFGIYRNQQILSFKNTSSFIFKWLMNRIVKFPVPLNTSMFRVIRRKVVVNLNSFREKERLIVGLMSYLGYKQAGVEIQRGKRFAGKTKYSLSKMIRLAVATITSFSYAPLRLAWLCGVVCVGVSVILGLLFLAQGYLELSLSSWKAIFLSVMFFFGLQFIFTGILGEYLGRVYSELQNRPLYIIDYVIKQGQVSER